VSITVENDGTETIQVRYLRITGAMLGIRFVRFQATTKLRIPAGTTRSIRQPADFFDLDHAASGYIDSAIQVVDEQRVTVASHAFAADVQGRFLSSEGTFLLEVIVFGLIGLLQIIVGVIRRSLSSNRFVRGVLYALTVASAGVGIVVGVAMLRVALVLPTTWVPVVLLATAAGFAVGYLSPGPLDRRVHEQSEERVIDLVASEAVARASGQNERRTTGESISHASGDHTVDITSTESEARVAPHESGGFAPHHDSGSAEPIE
jgi:hypothetical protein